MPSLAFLVATYNEEEEIEDLLKSVRPYVDTIVVSDDGSVDATVPIAVQSGFMDILVLNRHVASCEETRIKGFERITEDWVLILDADERIEQSGLWELRNQLEEIDKSYTHVYFSQDEYIDGQLTRSFAKIKLARRDSLHLPVGIHEDITCDGEPTNIGVKVIHRKTSKKQVTREIEYLKAYQQKVEEGKMTPERAAQVAQWHYFVREL